MYDVRQPLPLKPTPLIDQFRAEIRRRGLSFHTEKPYLQWVLRFVRFHNRKHVSINTTSYSSFKNIDMSSFEGP